jgi:hypothetical protein
MTEISFQDIAVKKMQRDEKLLQKEGLQDCFRQAVTELKVK